MGGGGGHARKYGLGGLAKKYGVKGGGPQKIAFKFGSDSICNDTNISARMPKNSVS